MLQSEGSHLSMYTLISISFIRSSSYYDRPLWYIGCWFESGSKDHVVDSPGGDLIVRLIYSQARGSITCDLLLSDCVMHA